MSWKVAPTSAKRSLRACAEVEKDQVEPAGLTRPAKDGVDLAETSPPRDASAIAPRMPPGDAGRESSAS